MDRGNSRKSLDKNQKTFREISFQFRLLSKSDSIFLKELRCRKIGGGICFFVPLSDIFRKGQLNTHLNLNRFLNSPSGIKKGLKRKSEASLYSDPEKSLTRLNFSKALFPTWVGEKIPVFLNITEDFLLRLGIIVVKIKSITLRDFS